MECLRDTDVQIGEPVSIENITLHVMAFGDKFDLKTRSMTLHALPPSPAEEKVISKD